MGDAQQRALAEITAVKARYGIASERVVDGVELRLLAEGHGRSPRGQSPGSRFTASESWWAYRDSGPVGYSPEAVSVTVLESDEVGDYFRAATLSVPLREVRTEQVADVHPLPSGLLGWLNTVPSTSQRVQRIGFTVTEPTGGGLIPGAPSPEVVAGAATDTPECFRFAVHVNVDRYSMITDDAYATRVVNGLVSRVLRRQLSKEVVTGDGTTVGDRRQLAGLAVAANMNVQAFSVSRVETVLKAISVVQGDGFEGPHQLLLNPVDAQELLNEATWRRDRLPTVDAILAADYVPAGTGYVGEFAAACDLYVWQGVTVEVSQSHASLFTAGACTVQATSWVYLDITSPDTKSGLCRMTGI